MLYYKVIIASITLVVFKYARHFEKDELPVTKSELKYIYKALTLKVYDSNLITSP